MNAERLSSTQSSTKFVGYCVSKGSARLVRDAVEYENGWTPSGTFIKLAEN